MRCVSLNASPHRHSNLLDTKPKYLGRLETLGQQTIHRGSSIKVAPTQLSCRPVTLIEYNTISLSALYDYWGAR